MCDGLDGLARRVARRFSRPLSLTPHAITRCAADTNRYVMEGTLTGEHPMAASETQQHTALNRRRMLGAPFAFAQAGLWLPLLQRCLCNYAWLEARCKYRSAMVSRGLRQGGRRRWRGKGGLGKVERERREA